MRACAWPAIAGTAAGRRLLPSPPARRCRYRPPGADGRNAARTARTAIPARMVLAPRSCPRTERRDAERLGDLVDLLHHRGAERNAVLLALDPPRATSSAITNCPTLSSPLGGAAKSLISRPNAAPLSGPASNPMMIESPLPL